MYTWISDGKTFIDIFKDVADIYLLIKLLSSSSWFNNTGEGQQSAAAPYTAPYLSTALYYDL